MTKKSILDEHVKYAWECDQASPVIPYSEAERAMDEWAGHLISNSSHTTTTLHVPKHILDEYAKQQIIEFNKWQRQNGYYQGTLSWWYDKNAEGIANSTEELYNQFIEQQNKP